MPEEFEVWLILGSSGEWDTYDEWYVSDADGAISWFEAKEDAIRVKESLNALAKAKSRDGLCLLDPSWNHNGEFYELEYIVIQKKFRRRG